MAKLTSASIRLVLKSSKQNKNGENPVYLVVCMKGRCERSSGVYCLAKYWDAKREIIKSGCPNAPVLNNMLASLKQQVTTKKLQYEMNGIDYTASMLLDLDEKVPVKPETYLDIMNKLIDERRLKPRTVARYNYSYGKLIEFIGRDNFKIEVINLALIKDMMKWLTVTDSTKRDVCATIASVWNYAIENELTTGVSPFKQFKYAKIYKMASRDYSIDLGNMMKLKEYWLNLVIVRDGSRWSYKDGAIAKIHKRTSEEFGIMYFLLMFYLNGSAPFDVAKLKAKDCSRVEIEGVDYWKVEFPRQKTGMSVSIRLKRDIFTIIALEHFLGESKEYVYPVVRWFDGMSPMQFQRQVNKTGESAIKWVKRAFEIINQETITKKVETGIDEPLVDINKVVLYCARHSFATAYLNTPGCTVNGLASLLARSPNTISTYIKALSADKDIASAVDFLY